jgi:hypothetical protein
MIKGFEGASMGWEAGSQLLFGRLTEADIHPKLAPQVDVEQALPRLKFLPEAGESVDLRSEMFHICSYLEI